MILKWRVDLLTADLYSVCLMNVCFKESEHDPDRNNVACKTGISRKTQYVVNMFCI